MSKKKKSRSPTKRRNAANKPAATKKRRAAAKPEHGSKKMFVLGLPGVSAAEVVERAAKKGISLSASYVANIRSKAKHSTAGKRGRPVSKRLMNGAADSDAQFTSIVADIGITRAQEIIDRVRSTMLEE